MNQCIGNQQKLTKILNEQRFLVTELILKTKYIESKLNITQEDFNVFKKEFITKLNPSPQDSKDSIIQSAPHGADVSDDSNSG